MCSVFLTSEWDVDFAISFATFGGAYTFNINNRIPLISIVVVIDLHCMFSVWDSILTFTAMSIQRPCTIFCL